MTPSPTNTPTSLPIFVPTLAITGTPEISESVPTPATAIPTPVPTFEVPKGTINILLLGSDAPLSTGDTRTDTIIIVAINQDGPTASILSIPRDLYVYIPGWTMNRINTALAHGSAIGYPGGGIGLLKQTILYNFGIPIHYYARVDFEGFKEIVDAIGGVEISVSCEFKDWRLKSPELDPQDENNWEVYTLEPGIYHMDGDLALWYARSRLMSNDFDRGRRQQQLLHAIFNQGVDLGLISQIPTFWNVYREKVDTDLDIGRILQLATLAPAIRENGIQHLYLAGKTQSWTTPEGAYVQLPIWEGDNKMKETFSRLFRPPSLSRANHAPIFVEVINTTNNPDLARLAADNLAWYGFIPVISPDKPDENSQTRLIYYGPNFKGSYDWLISWVFGMSKSDIELVTDNEAYPYNYQVFLGNDYDPCLPELYAPQLFLTP
ncbi:MAG: LytR family transcriptional regulator [Chloroflexi bacterium]|nr:MAG: LytR family transcriptional regulator [Chloroflexota bacterium]